MRTANPTYDVVFKFLMEDLVSAKIILSIILGCVVEELVFMPQEISKARDPKSKRRKSKETSLTLLRLDFSATILTKDGERKHIIIEIQKSKFGSPTIRFREYLGSQYRDENNVETSTFNNRIVRSPIPIVGIYFLGSRLKHTKAPIVGVSRTYTNLLTREVLPHKEEFIEALSHDMFVIQIPYLTQEKSSDLAALLSLFDQNITTEPKGHFIEVSESDYPQPFHHLINRLHMAAQKAHIIAKMQAEDLMIAEYDDLDEELDKALLEVAEAHRQVDAEREQRQVAQKREKEAQKREKEAQKREEEERHQKEEAQKMLAVTVKLLHQSMSVAQIAAMLGKSETEISALLEK